MSDQSVEPILDELSPGALAGRLDDVVTGIGERIKELRLREGMTLQGLAAATGLSLSMLSTVERGRTTASLGTLNAVASALGVQITSLLARSGGNESPIIGVADQIVDVTEGGATRRTAVYRSDFDLEVYVDDFQPGTSYQRSPSQHPGHEFGIVIEGELEIQLGGEIFSAAEGEVVQYSAKQSHLIQNSSPNAARAVWINIRRL